MNKSLLQMQIKLVAKQFSVNESKLLQYLLQSQCWNIMTNEQIFLQELPFEE